MRVEVGWSDVPAWRWLPVGAGQCGVGATECRFASPKEVGVQADGGSIEPKDGALHTSTFGDGPDATARIALRTSDPLQPEDPSGVLTARVAIGEIRW